MTPHEFQRLLDRYSAGRCTPEEAKLVEQWYSNIKSSQDQFATPDDYEEQLWSRIKPARQLHPNFNIFLKIAATITIFALVTVAILKFTAQPNEEKQTANVSVSEQGKNENTEVVSNGTSFSKKITLNDGSTIVLQPGSSVSYPRQIDPAKRVVRLSGEGFFDVKRDPTRPFYVYSNEIITEVLGTSFNIKAYDSEKEIVVAVKTGKVSVYANPDKQRKHHANLQNVLLTPNQKVIYDREAEIVSKQIVETPAVVVENTDYFTMQFDGKPVTTIFDVLEENYGINIEYDADALKDCVLTTKMAEEGFYERIDIICKAINAEYTTTDAVITIKSNGCK
jgi:transmembrane sensor